MAEQKATQIFKGKIINSGSNIKQFLYEFNRLSFPSQSGESFRASVSSVSEGILIWFEGKKTKQQWQITVKNLSECGPGGLPEEAIVAFLKVNRFHVINLQHVVYLLYINYVAESVGKH